MAFKFKNMPQYIRNAVEPIIKASHMVQDSRISAIRKKFEQDLAAIQKEFDEKFETAISSLTTTVEQKLTAQQKKIDSFPTIQVGTVIIWPFSRNPSDMAYYLECNGQTISQAAYPELYAIVGSKVPNFKGMFLRGYGSQVHTKNNGSTVGSTATTHTSGSLLAVQGDTIREISGVFFGENAKINYASVMKGAFYETQAYGSSNPGIGESDSDNPRTGFSAARVTPTANEIRPVNIAVRYLIRAKP